MFINAFFCFKIRFRTNDDFLYKLYEYDSKEMIIHVKNDHFSKVQLLIGKYVNDIKNAR